MVEDKQKEIIDYNPILAFTWRLIRIFPSVRKAQDEGRAEEKK